MSPGEGAFAALGLDSPLAEGLAQLGYEDPTPIQSAAIPAMLGGGDLVCQAATGTGKTAAFALPLLMAAHTAEGSGPFALVLAPTRELCMQVAEAIHRYGRPYGTRTLPVFGGQPIGRQISALRRGVDVVVATPGRAVDLLERRSLTLDEVRTVVLDEADEMLDMGFAEELDAILSRAPAQRQTVMFSATMPKRIRRIAEAHLRDPQNIKIARPDPSEVLAPTVRQAAYLVARQHKVAALARILDVESPEATLVFCRTRADVDHLTESLNGLGYRAEALHGGMDQAQRDRVMGRLRSRSAELLVATDVAARGLDVEHLTHVINYDVPAAPETYVHRIGRVGRAGRTGCALTIAEPRERRQLSVIERTTGMSIPVSHLPSSQELRQLRLEATRRAVAERCRDDDDQAFEEVVSGLVAEFGADRVALAAVAMAHLATVGDSGEEEIPAASAPRDQRARKDGSGRERGAKHESRHDSGRDDRSERRRGDRGHESGAGKKRGAEGKRGVRTDAPQPGKVRLLINLGKDAGIRPQDVVGAIAHESGVRGSDIGPLDITARKTFVDVPAESADAVVNALTRTRIRGRRVKVRTDRS